MSQKNGGIVMNMLILCGRLVRDPEVRYSAGQRSMAVSKYTLAVERKGKKKEGEQSADFINCIAFDKSAEFSEKYFTKGLRVLISGRIQTGSYTNKDGYKVYTTDVIVEEQEFADGKNQIEKNNNDPGVSPYGPMIGDGFMNIPEGIEDDGLPFN